MSDHTCMPAHCPICVHDDNRKLRAEVERLRGGPGVVSVDTHRAVVGELKREVERLRGVKESATKLADVLGNLTVARLFTLDMAEAKVAKLADALRNLTVAAESVWPETLPDGGSYDTCPGCAGVHNQHLQNPCPYQALRQRAREAKAALADSDAEEETKP